jgi:hypothetical protein
MQSAYNNKVSFIFPPTLTGSLDQQSPTSFAVLGHLPQLLPPWLSLGSNYHKISVAMEFEIEFLLPQSTRE